MDIKNSNAVLQLRNSRIVKSSLTNDFAVLPPNSNLDISTSMGNFQHNIQKRNDGYSGVLQLKVVITCKDKNSDQKLRVSVTVEGYFTFKGDDESQFEQMLFLNGNSTLYSIARAYVINITSQSLISGQIILPMINFLEIYKQLEQNKDKK